MAKVLAEGDIARLIMTPAFRHRTQEWQLGHSLSISSIIFERWQHALRGWPWRCI